MSTREEYINKLTQQLKEWNAKINSLQEKAKNATGDVKVKYDEKIEELQKDIELIKSGFNEFGQVSEKVFKHLEKGLKKSIKDLGKAFKDVADEFKETEKSAK